MISTAQQAKAVPRTAEAPVPPQAPTPRSDLGTSIEQAVREAVSEALRSSRQSGDEARLAQERAREAIARIRDDLRARNEASTPVIAQQFPPFPQDVIPPQAVDIATAFFVTIAVIIIGLPLARAFARRMDRRSQAVVQGGGPDVSPRLDRIEQAIEAVAIEVERVSEGQRYATKILSEMRALPAPNPVGAWPEGAARAPEPVPRAAAEPRRG